MKNFPDGRFFVLSSDATLVACAEITDLAHFNGLIADLHSGQVVHKLSLDMSALGMVRFTPDGKAIMRKVVSNGGYALQYQPIDGSAPHLILGPVPEDLTAFAWSPSTSLLGVLQLRSSSDVVLITDIAGKPSR